MIELSEAEYIPIRQVPEIIRFYKSMKIVKGIFWFLRIFAFLGFGLLLQSKFIPYPSSSVRTIVYWVVLFASILSFLLGFFCNLFLARGLYDLTLVGCMILGLKVNQLLLLAKNEINSKKILRRRLAINALPLVSSEEVLEVLTELEIKDRSRLKKAIKNKLIKLLPFNFHNGYLLVVRFFLYRGSDMRSDDSGILISFFLLKISFSD